MREIHDYIAEDAPQRANGVVDRLTARSTTLTQPPLTGRRVPEYLEHDLREVLDRPFRLIYRVLPDRIEIITVKHYRQRLADLPDDL